jgi:light-regulated signal transduction histidine kinase (bacteriophytochrome)
MADLDLSECEREPIHQLGAVQAHAVLIAVDEKSGRVSHVSDNGEALFGAPPRSWLGTPWGPLAAALGLDPDPRAAPDAPGASFHTVDLGRGRVAVRAHRWRGRAIWELEPAVDDDEEGGEEPVVADALAVAPGSLNVFRACQLTAEAYARATGYDRVMVYRFHPDWTGEVVAEVRKPDALPYLGLRYPATDIPSQARALFLLQPLRIIVDVQGVTSPILEAPGAGPLDCSHVTSRSVSPYHLEYLRNMGVGATIASSLVVDGRLWGLMVGHHDGPRRCPARRAASAIALGQRLAQWIEEQDRATSALRERRAATESAVLGAVFDGASPEEALRALLFGRLAVQNLLEARAAAVITEDAICAVGPGPSAGWLRALYEWAVGGAVQPGAVGAWTSVPPELPGAEGGEEAPAGLLVGVAHAPGVAPVVVVALRAEVAEEVCWGGDPATPATRDAQQRIRPRKSFDLWRQVTRGKSRPWTDAQIARLGFVIGHLSALIADTRRPLSAAIGDLLSLKDRDPRHAHLELEARQEGIALVLDHRQGHELRLHDANPGMFELLGVDPLFDRDRSLAEILASAGVELARLDAPAARVEFWSPARGLRILQTERRRALLVVHGGDQRSWHTVHFLDVTMDQRLMLAMTVARDQARLAELTQSALLSNMSHEMRTPLNAIIGLAEILRDDAELSADQRSEFLAHMQDAGQHLLGLVNGLLDLAAHEAGRLSLQQVQAFDLAALVRNALAWLRPMAERKEVTLAPLEASLDPALVSADEQRIRQVVLNLVSNAIKFSSRHGTVSCRLGEDPVSRAVVFEVRDNGVGIPRAHLSRVFERFFRVSGDASTEGTGLGLAISKALVELHGGTIALSSRQGQGTVVRIELPGWRRA